VVDRDPPSGVRAQGRLVIRVERVTLPAGLRAIAHRDSRGNLIIYVSDSLDAGCARAAVRKAIRASRRAAWRVGLPPVGVALLVALRQWLRGAVTALRAGPAAWVTATTALVVGGSAAAVFHHARAAPARRGRARPAALVQRPAPPAAEHAGPAPEPGAAGGRQARRADASQAAGTRPHVAPACASVAGTVDRTVPGAIPGPEPVTIPLRGAVTIPVPVGGQPGRVHHHPGHPGVRVAGQVTPSRSGHAAPVRSRRAGQASACGPGHAMASRSGHGEPVRPWRAGQAMASRSGHG